MAKPIKNIPFKKTSTYASSTFSTRKVERDYQNSVIKYLTSEGGLYYSHGSDLKPDDFRPHSGLYLPDLIAFLQATQIKHWNHFVELCEQRKKAIEDELEAAFKSSVSKFGLLRCLHKGIMAKGVRRYNNKIN